MQGHRLELSQNPFALLSLIAAPAVLTTPFGAGAHTSSKVPRAIERMHGRSRADLGPYSGRHRSRALAAAQAVDGAAAVLLLKRDLRAPTWLSLVRQRQPISSWAPRWLGGVCTSVFSCPGSALGAGRRLRRRRGPCHRLLSSCCCKRPTSRWSTCRNRPRSSGRESSPLAPSRTARLSKNRRQSTRFFFSPGTEGNRRIMLTAIVQDPVPPHDVVSEEDPRKRR